MVKTKYGHQKARLELSNFKKRPKPRRKLDRRMRTNKLSTQVRDCSLPFRVTVQRDHNKKRLQAKLAKREVLSARLLFKKQKRSLRKSTRLSLQ